MENLFLCYSGCSTCRKAEKWLEEKGISFVKRDIKANNPSEEEIRQWHKKSELPLKKFFNTSGQVYKSLNLKEKLPQMSQEQMYGILASDGMLVKRPIFIAENKILVGFKEIIWEECLAE